MPHPDTQAAINRHVEAMHDALLRGDVAGAMQTVTLMTTASVMAPAPRREKPLGDHHYDEKFDVWCSWDESTVASYRVRIWFDWTPGETEFKPHGRWTDPEHYDPGSGDEVDFRGAELLNDDGTRTPLDRKDFRSQWAEKWLDQHRDSIRRIVTGED